MLSAIVGVEASSSGTSALILAWRALDSHAPPIIDALFCVNGYVSAVLCSNFHICAFCSCSVWCGAEVLVTSKCKEVAMSSHQRELVQILRFLGRPPFTETKDGRSCQDGVLHL